MLPAPPFEPREEAERAKKEVGFGACAEQKSLTKQEAIMQ